MREQKSSIFSLLTIFAVVALFFIGSTPVGPLHKETKELMRLVRDAAKRVEEKGDSAFAEFRQKGSRWLHDDAYIFVIDRNGFVYLNPLRPELEGKNHIGLRDLAGKPFIKSFINTATGYASKQEGWSHYVWYKPGEENAMWKTSYVKLVKAPSGKEYIVGSGLYNMKMEKVFVVDVVDEAAALIKKDGRKAFPQLQDPLGDFNYLSTYVFVLDAKGKDLINPAFPGYEGQNVLDLKDTQGKYFIRDIMKALEQSDSVWIDYMWPKPRQAAHSKKSTYVRKVISNKEVFYVGSGVYLD